MRHLPSRDDAADDMFDPLAMLLVGALMFPGLAILAALFAVFCV
jgi:hypothetical protein